MVLSFGTLVLLSVGGVLALSVGANYRNTFDLLGAQSTLLIDAMEDSLRAEMGRAESAVDGVAQLYAQGEFQIDDEAMFAVLAGALSAAPEAMGRLVVALGSNALLKRGEEMTADSQRKNAKFAAEALAPLCLEYETVITHGNGPQVGLLALQEIAYEEGEDYPLDVLGAETEGMIG